MDEDREELRTAFTAAYDRYASPIYRHCVIRIRDTALAEDLMEDTFLRLWTQMRKGTVIENTQAFLYAIANNLIIDHVRKHRGRETVPIDTLVEEGREPGEDTREEMVNRLDGQRAMAALERIAEPYRTALILRYVDGLSPAEIARATGNKPGVIWTRLYRGIRMLYASLNDTDA